MSLPRRQIPAYPRVWAPGRPSGVLLIVALTGGMGAAQFCMWALGLDVLREALVLDGTGVRMGEYWRFFTYPLLHANVPHFLANALVLYLAGREIEPIIGRRHVLGLGLASTFLGGIACWLVAPAVGVFGISAAAAAVLAAYSTIMPELGQSVRVFYIFPVRFRAKYAAFAVAALAAAGVATQTATAAGPAGIFTGCVLGWLWAKRLGFGGLFQWQRVKLESREREQRHQRMSADEFISAEIDPILEKISREGTRSLTRAERRTLELGREKIVAKKSGAALP